MEERARLCTTYEEGMNLYYLYITQENQIVSEYSHRRNR